MEYTYLDTVVVGTGAAGYNAALSLKQQDGRSVAIVTEAVNCGTSRNTGSDKQTYYKLGLGGDSPDSVRTMAENLFACGGVDGDNALCEAALSPRCFLKLCELGVAFPVNRYGEYVGYKTDHDPYARATSAGPLTSKFMTEALQKAVGKENIPVYSGLLAVEILKDAGRVCGLLCIDTASGEFRVFSCNNIILATGGPAGIYADSVFPKCHTGTSSLALNAGALMQNLTEWQYGLASIQPRWNVSGSYMQVLPRFVSIDEDGNEYEFLADYFSDIYEALSLVFLKGYQWPFDSKKVLSGSSVIDLLVYRECVLKKRRVYLDFTKNPFGLDEIGYDKLSDEAYTYLKNAEVCFGTPIQRLLKMNTPAVELYKGKGLDLTTEYLEIALCAQHNNGGIAVDMWWQTGVEGLFAAGECAGTHGVTRPGGSALNAGQVGSLRAAQFISTKPMRWVNEQAFCAIAEGARKKHLAFCASVLDNEDNIDQKTALAQRRMSDCGAAIRNSDTMRAALAEIQAELNNIQSVIGVKSPKLLYKAYKLLDILTVQAAVLTAMVDFSETVGKTRGSALYTDPNGDLRQGLEELFRFQTDPNRVDRIQSLKLEDGRYQVSWRQVRPLPENNDFFENIWRQYRENKNIY